MIIIFRALSQVRKGWWRLWFPHKSGWDSGLNKKRGHKKKRKGPNKKMREKERRDNVTILFTTLMLKSSTIIFMIESVLCCHFHILVGIFHYRTWLVYSNDGLPQNALGLREQASWMHIHLVLLLSFHTLIDLVHPLHGNTYSLTLISIDGHLHSSLIRLVDVRLSSPFCLLHNHHSIPPIVLYPGLMLMYCVEIEKVWEHQKYETIYWLVIGVVHHLNIFCGEDRA